MTRILTAVLLLAMSLPLTAAKRRAAAHPAALTRESITAVAARAANRVTISYARRLHWENAVYFDGLVLLGEQMELRDPGSGVPFIERAVSILLNSDDAIETVRWGDGAPTDMARVSRQDALYLAICTAREPVTAFTAFSIVPGFVSRSS